jgi:glycosyltransferase involved in cell wall biosynthesis
MPEVLFVSKPVAPPWNDSGKNLVRDLAAHLARWRGITLARPGDPPVAPAVRVEHVYGPAAGRYSPALRDNARVAARLLLGRRVDLWHFFFAPNARSSSVGRLACAARRMPSVQTVASAPRQGAPLRRWLFADVSVVLSRHTEKRFLAEGVAPARLRRIAPCAPALAPPGDDTRRASRRALGWPEDVPVLLYAGDLEVGGGAERSIDALAALSGGPPGPGRETILALACRAKTPAAASVEAALRRRVAALGLAPRVRWLGETPHILGALGAADVVLLPSTDLYAKMDLPLVLLEAMALGRPVLVAEGTPAAELADGDAALATPAHPEAIAAALRPLLDDARGRAALGDRARAAALGRYAPGPMAAAYEALYDDVFGA